MDTLAATLNRRDFLRAGALAAGAVGLGLPGLAAPRSSEASCILLMLVGGPSQLDTFDPKPGAPATIRGPFRPISSRVPGLQMCEHLPRLAGLANRLALVRSVHHDTAPIHETGHQLLQTGRLAAGWDHPHLGAVASRLIGPRAAGVPPFVVLGGRIGNTGVSISHGQTAGFLGGQHEPVLLPRADLASEPPALRERYGRNPFGQSCLQARRLVEKGVRVVVINMFDTVFNQITWDCHADRGALPATLKDYETSLCPMFDQACSALLDDLAERGLLASTLVGALGEFGRTPELNHHGGRDHWPGCWSILLAGGGVQGGRVIGASDAHGAEPRDRPVTPAEVTATIYRSLGIDGSARLTVPDGQVLTVSDARPIGELF